MSNIKSNAEPEIYSIDNIVEATEVRVWEFYVMTASGASIHWALLIVLTVMIAEAMLPTLSLSHTCVCLLCDVVSAAIKS